jgi:hypothetical protein
MGVIRVTGQRPAEGSDGIKANKQTNSVTLSPQTNYTDLATATC